VGRISYVRIYSTSYITKYVQVWTERSLWILIHYLIIYRYKSFFLSVLPTDDNVIQLLSLLQEYQMDALLERAEEVLCNQSSSVRLFVLAQKFNLTRLHESTLSYLKRAPMSRLKTQAEFEQLDQSFLIELLADKLEKFESSIDSLREVRMVLERKKPTTFPGMHLLCNTCTGAREQQVDCTGCMKSCCQKLSIILRDMEA